MALHRDLLPRGIGVGVGLDPLEPALRGGGPGRELRVRAALPAGGGRGGRGLHRGCRPQARTACQSCSRPRTPTRSASGFEIFAFPCNQFGGQELGIDKEIVQIACLPSI